MSLQAAKPTAHFARRFFAAAALCGRRFGNIRRQRAPRRRVARVVGGYDALRGAFPWTASLKFRADGAHHCGAAIISSRYLLSAAHCFERHRDPAAFLVVTGDTDRGINEGTEQRFRLAAIHFYPRYAGERARAAAVCELLCCKQAADDFFHGLIDIFEHDIVVLELERGRSIQFDEANQPICLAPRGYEYASGRICLVSGFGSNGSGQLLCSSRVFVIILLQNTHKNCKPPLCRSSKPKFVGQLRVYTRQSVERVFAPAIYRAQSTAALATRAAPFACEHDGLQRANARRRLSAHFRHFLPLRHHVSRFRSEFRACSNQKVCCTYFALSALGATDVRAPISPAF